MKQYRVVLQARFSPEILERVLRVVRHRGFRIYVMSMETASDAQNINIELTVASLQLVGSLFNQLSKLVDVAYVEIQQPTSQQIRAWAQRNKKNDDEES